MRRTTAALVTITATRVGLLSTPLKPTETCCWRCGQVYDHSAQNVLAGSPCMDCRQTLRAEGDTTVWRRQRGVS